MTQVKKLIACLCFFSVFSLGTTALADIYDDFNGDGINTSLWNIWDPENLLSQSGGSLHAGGPPNQQDIHLDIPGLFYGDLEITVAFKGFYFNGTVDEEDRYNPGITLSAYFEGADSQSAHQLYVGREVNSMSGDIFFSGLWVSNQDWKEVQTSSTEGKLIIKRVGSTFQTFYNDGIGTILLDTFTNAWSGGLKFGITISTGYLGEFSIDVDYVGIFKPKSDAALDFGPLGLYRYDGTTLEKISSNDPDTLASYGNTLVSNFPGLGLYEYDLNKKWLRLTKNDAQEGMCGTDDALYVDFGSGVGLYQYDKSWTKISGNSPEQMWCIGNRFYVDFGLGMGLYTYDGSWSRLTKTPPQDLCPIGSTLYVNFGSGVGLYKYDGSWTRISKNSPQGMCAVGSDLYVDFGSGVGIYKYDGKWKRINKTSAEGLRAVGSTLYVDFGALGLHKYEEENWVRISKLDALNMDSYAGKLVVGFPSVGLYEYGGSWKKINPNSVEDMIPVNLTIDDIDIVCRVARWDQKFYRDWSPTANYTEATFVQMTINKPGCSELSAAFVTDPNGAVYDLACQGNFGIYLYNKWDTVPIGTYDFTIDHQNGHTYKCQDVLEPGSLAIPELVNWSNGDITNTTTPFIDWNDVPGAARYWVRFWNDTRTSIVFMSGDITASEFATPAGFLEPGKKYLLEIMAVDDAYDHASQLRIYLLTNGASYFESHVFSGHWADQYFAELYVVDLDQKATSITVTGPGISGTMDLSYNSSHKRWWHTYNPFLGSSPPTEPQIYTFQIDDGSEVYSCERTITGYVNDFATNLLPVGEVSQPIVFSWTGISGATFYGIELSDQDGMFWSRRNIHPGTTSVVYDGPALEDGKTYNYAIISIVVTGGERNASFAVGTFTFRSP